MHIFTRQEDATGGYRMTPEAKRAWSTLTYIALGVILAWVIL